MRGRKTTNRSNFWRDNPEYENDCLNILWSAAFKASRYLKLNPMELLSVGWLKVIRYMTPEKLKYAPSSCFREMMKQGVEIIKIRDNCVDDGFFETVVRKENPDNYADEIVELAFASLPNKKYRLIFRLYFFDGLNCVEISEKISMTPQGVNWALHEGLRYCRKSLCKEN